MIEPLVSTVYSLHPAVYTPEYLGVEASYYPWGGGSRASDAWPRKAGTGSLKGST